MMDLQNLQKSQIAVLLGYRPKISDCDSSDFKNFDNDEDTRMLIGSFEQANNLVDGKFLDILKSEFTGEILCPGKLVGDLNQHLTLTISKFLQQADCSYSRHIRECMVMFVGVAALQLFVQKNWTGGADVINELPLFSAFFRQQNSDAYSWALENLTCGLSVFNLANNLELLGLAKAILCYSLTMPLTISWWRFRCLRICQSVLLELNAQYYDEGKDLLTEMQKVIPMCDDAIKTETEIRLNLEAFHFFIIFGNVSIAKEHLSCAQKLAGLEVELTGSLGKRTRFQQVPHAQLILSVSRTLCTSSLNEKPSFHDFPQDVALEDDTLLNKIMYLGLNDSDITSLLPLEQAIVLGLCQQIQKNSANDELLQEEAMAYLERILKEPQSWCVQLSSLFIRCKIEKNKTRKMERVLAQLQVLCDALDAKTDAPLKRLQFFYDTSTPSWWIIKKELADVMISLGAVKSALNEFLQLELWEEVAMCYMAIQEPERAANILKQQLSVTETSTLWCLLGDVEANPQHYEKAWTLSAGRSSRAQKSLGLWHFRNKDYRKSIPYFLKSTELNSLDLQVWYPLAFSALQTEEYDLAAKSYRRIVSLDPDSYQGWNNLSKVYVLMKQKERAWRTLQEALRCNYEEWRIWENFLIISVDVGAFEDAITSWHRLIDIKGKHIDDEVLSVIVTAVMKDIKDINGQPASILTSKALKLLGHITATETNSAKTWSLYGFLLGTTIKSSESAADIMDRVVQYHQKAYRCATTKSGWEKDADLCREAFTYALNLIDAGAQLLQLSSHDNVKKLLQSIRLMVKSGISLAAHSPLPSSEMDLTTLRNNLEIELNKLNYAAK